MGGRQSSYPDVERRPRANSNVENAMEAGRPGGSSSHGTGRAVRPLSHYPSHDNDDDDDDDEEMSAGLARLGLTLSSLASGSSSTSARQYQHILNQLTGATTSPAADGEGPSASSSAPSASHNSHSHGHRHSGTRLRALPLGNGRSLRSGSDLAGPSRRDRHSVPMLNLLNRDAKCPICHREVPSDDAEMHLVLCFTRPKIGYNEELLEVDKEDECAICLDQMVSGQTIARLPCLCIYHKICIDEWFKRKNCCPEHPDEEAS